jgi:hypothetical protein
MSERADPHNIYTVLPDVLLGVDYARRVRQNRRLDFEP